MFLLYLVYPFLQNFKNKNKIRRKLRIEKHNKYTTGIINSEWAPMLTMMVADQVSVEDLTNTLILISTIFDIMVFLS